MPMIMYIAQFSLCNEPTQFKSEGLGRHAQFWYPARTALYLVRGCGSRARTNGSRHAFERHSCSLIESFGSLIKQRHQELTCGFYWINLWTQMGKNNYYFKVRSIFFSGTLYTGFLACLFFVYRLLLTSGVSYSAQCAQRI